ncbi:MAG: YggU family protein [Candidatus Schekmanbacteria bacterium]|nr:YggU family protein [Candidatus Schekmanbacteria bacterium]
MNQRKKRGQREKKSDSGNSSNSRIILEVKVIPRSSRREVIIEGENRIKVKVNAPPVEGEANDECIKAIYDYFHLRHKNQIEIMSGKSSRNKVIRISELSSSEAEEINNLLKG